MYGHKDKLAVGKPSKLVLNRIVVDLCVPIINYGFQTII